MVRRMTTPDTPAAGVTRLLQLEGGKASAVAEKLSSPERSCSRQLVEYWVKKGYVTGTWAPLVYQVYRIPLHELNPAVYPKQFVA